MKSIPGRRRTGERLCPTGYSSTARSYRTDGGFGADSSGFARRRSTIAPNRAGVRKGGGDADHVAREALSRIVVGFE